MSGTALVTGGSRGIGRAVVEDLISQGYEVLNFSRTAPAKLLPGEIFESVDLGNSKRTREAALDWAAKKDILNLVSVKKWGMRCIFIEIMKGFSHKAI
jgi:NAD(P)-dependent dehydrogenase (short-subunit alcohol dehydrogenase family)